MEILYVTWDHIGSQTGGGVVTHNELEALKELGNVTVINPPITKDPFEADQLALNEYLNNPKKYDLAHFYSNTFSSLIKVLKSKNVKITYTAAAHNIETSKYEHAYYNLNFDYPHLTDPTLFKKYIEGYLLADLIICPSTHSADVMSGYGCNVIQIIPHGTYLPKNPKITQTFSVGYLGSTGPDKGLRHLLRAWSDLNYQDALLLLGGKNSFSSMDQIRHCKGSIFLMGYLLDVEDFYNRCAVYVQPSTTEGFGIEVIEAMSYNKAVICSSGAGACDCITNNFNGKIVPHGSPDDLASAIDYYKNNQLDILKHGMEAGKTVKEKYLWSTIKNQYKKVWNELLASV